MRMVDLDTASRILGISQDAVRKRIRRGSIEAEKDYKGRWKVLLPDEIPDTDQSILDALRSENDFLRRELERKDHLLMALMQKVPQLEAPREKPTPWWRRLFGRE